MGCCAPAGPAGAGGGAVCCDGQKERYVAVHLPISEWPPGPVSASLEFKAENLGLLPLQMCFSKGPQTLEFPWLRGRREQRDSVGGGLGRNRNWRG